MTPFLFVPLSIIPLKACEATAVGIKLRRHLFGIKGGVEPAYETKEGKKPTFE